MAYADNLRLRNCSNCCYEHLPKPEYKNTLTTLITDPFGALDKKSKTRYINYMKKMKQKTVMDIKIRFICKKKFRKLLAPQL